MVYGSSNFVGIPVELILGAFLAEQGEVVFGQLEDCKGALLQHFEKYVAEGEPEMFLVHRFVKEVVGGCLPDLRKMRPVEVRDGLDLRLNMMRQQWALHPRWDERDPVDRMQPSPDLLEAVGLALRHQLGRDCGLKKPVRVDTALVDQVANLVLLMLSRNPSLSGTGIVLTGYGDHALFPGYIEIVIEGAFMGKVRHFVKSKGEVSHFHPAFLVSFAQSQVIEGFLLGIDPHIHRFLLQSFRDKFFELIDLFVQSVDADQQMALELALKEVMENTMSSLQEELRDHQDQVYTHSTSQALALLAPEELAEIGDTLITMTAMKKRIRNQTEDVGGPVDIAMLSKQGGFAWLQRKPQYSFKNTQRYGQQFPRCS